MKLYDEIETKKYYIEKHFSKYLCYEDYIKIKECDDLYLKSACLVRVLFQNRVDKVGKPYLGHLLRVSNRMTTLEGQVAGLLHDTVEDISDITFEDLLEIGIPSSIIEVLRLVTKEPVFGNLSRQEKLKRYQKKIEDIIESKNDLALELKIADISDNYNPKRLETYSMDMRNWFSEKYEFNLLKLKKEKEKRKILC